MIPHGDIVGVFTPTNILFRRGWQILTPHEDTDDDYDDGDDDDHDDDDYDDCKCGATSGLGRNCIKWYKTPKGASLSWYYHDLRNVEVTYMDECLEAQDTKLCPE